MDIRPQEIDNIKTIGKLHGEDVKLLSLKGGLNVAVGKKSLKKKKQEPLAAGSHQGIVIHQIEKQFKNNFHSKLAKSETEQYGEVKDISTYLESNLTDQGISMYRVSEGYNLGFVVANPFGDIVKHEYQISDNKLKITSENALPDFYTQSIAESLSKAIVETAEEFGYEIEV